MKNRILAVACICLMLVMVVHTPVQREMLAATEENLIQNGCFEDASRLDLWSVHQNGAVITAEKSDTPIVGEITSYGKITGRTSNYQCFAEDLTGRVEKNQTYEYTFYVMLDAKDYADAPASQRTVEISPHIRAGGTDSYSQGVSGTVQQVVEPGVWTKFTGTFTPSWNGELEMVALRFLEQGTDYGQGQGIMGTYYITGISLYPKTEETVKVQKDVIDLKKAVGQKMGEDFLVGTSIVNVELADAELMGLVTKHFNTVTLGNELKPDAMFGYTSFPKTETVILHETELLVPILDFSRAERTLDAIYRWNQKHPEEFIKIRGHVLIWHSQTPEWFFHEDYNVSKPLVDAATMKLRQEWYIKSVAEHFTGEDSKYKTMFYAWDVVNEAVSDGTGTYRNAEENSMWWAVYESNEFIIDAFRFANQYLPEDIALFYNDYNECVMKKAKGICALLQDVKAAEGTRIDGMGMQGHYQTRSTPSIQDFLQTARMYAEIVDQIQITEFDLKASSEYIGTDYSRALEYQRQAERYHDFYEAIQTLAAEQINITGITFWGVIDKNSWLQTANSAGGGSDGKQSQVPLLFDNDYQVKPAFWAFAEEETYQKLMAVEPTKTPKATVTPKPTPTNKPEPTVTVQAEETAPTLPEEQETVGSESGQKPVQAIWFVALSVAVIGIIVGICLLLYRRKNEKK